MADLYIPVQDDVTKIPGSTVSRGWQLFFQRLVQAVGASGDSRIITTEPIAVSNTDVLALPTTPATLLAAPGDGLEIDWLWIDLISTIVVPYTNIDASYCSMIARLSTGAAESFPINDDTTTTPPVANITALLTTSRRTRLFRYAETYLSPPAFSTQVFSKLYNPIDFENFPLVVSVDNNGTGNFMGGDAGNSLSWSITYRIRTAL